MANDTQNLLLADAEKAAAMLCLSKRYFLSLAASGKLGPESILLGRRRLWSVEELSEWVRQGCPVKRDYRNGGNGG